ncbi:MAG: hypothetical protein C6W56_02295 [Caldibacillus debilis]|nr:MAG: hypothetical protein C6W56_02295 [Caldibacillus debilis]
MGRILPVPERTKDLARGNALAVAAANRAAPEEGFWTNGISEYLKQSCGPDDKPESGHRHLPRDFPRGIFCHESKGSSRPWPAGGPATMRILAVPGRRPGPLN